MTRTRSISFPNTRDELDPLFDKIQRFTVTSCLVPANINIKASESPTVKTGSPSMAMIDGVLVKLPINTDMAALVGTIADGKKGAFVFTIDINATPRTYASNLSASTVGEIVLPSVPDGEAVIGFAVVENETGNDFVGGTTALDSEGLDVTYVYVNYPFLPELVNL